MEVGLGSVPLSTATRDASRLSPMIYQNLHFLLFLAFVFEHIHLSIHVQKYIFRCIEYIYSSICIINST